MSEEQKPAEAEEAPSQPTEEDIKKRWESMTVDQKINTVANNAISRQEAFTKMGEILEKVQTIALRLENLELKQKLQVLGGGDEKTESLTIGLEVGTRKMSLPPPLIGDIGQGLKRKWMRDLDIFGHKIKSVGSQKRVRELVQGYLGS